MGKVVITLEDIDVESYLIKVTIEHNLSDAEQKTSPAILTAKAFRQFMDTAEGPANKVTIQ